MVNLVSKSVKLWNLISDVDNDLTLKVLLFYPTVNETFARTNPISCFLWLSSWEGLFDWIRREDLVSLDPEAGGKKCGKWNPGKEREWQGRFWGLALFQFQRHCIHFKQKFENDECWKRKKNRIQKGSLIEETRLSKRSTDLFFSRCLDFSKSRLKRTTFLQTSPVFHCDLSIVSFPPESFQRAFCRFLVLQSSRSLGRSDDELTSRFWERPYPSVPIRVALFHQWDFNLCTSTDRIREIQVNYGIVSRI